MIESSVYKPSGDKVPGQILPPQAAGDRALASAPVTQAADRLAAFERHLQQPSFGQAAEAIEDHVFEQPPHADSQELQTMLRLVLQHKHWSNAGKAIAVRDILQALPARCNAESASRMLAMIRQIDGNDDRVVALPGIVRVAGPVLDANHLADIDLLLDNELNRAAMVVELAETLHDPCVGEPQQQRLLEHARKLASTIKHQSNLEFIQCAAPELYMASHHQN